MLVSYYIRSAEHDRTAAEQLQDLGFDVAGESRPRLDAPGVATTDRMAGRAVTNWAPPIPKVTALITRPGAGGPELLVFDHGLAGIQLPAGTVDEGESFATAALREGVGGDRRPRPRARARAGGDPLQVRRAYRCRRA